MIAQSIDCLCMDNGVKTGLNMNPERIGSLDFVA